MTEVLGNLNDTEVNGRVVLYRRLKEELMADPKAVLAQSSSIFGSGKASEIKYQVVLNKNPTPPERRQTDLRALTLAERFVIAYRRPIGSLDVNDGNERVLIQLTDPEFRITNRYYSELTNEDLALLKEKFRLNHQMSAAQWYRRLIMDDWPAGDPAYYLLNFMNHRDMTFPPPNPADVKDNWDADIVAKYYGATIYEAGAYCYWFTVLDRNTLNTSQKFELDRMFNRASNIGVTNWLNARGFDKGLTRAGDAIKAALPEFNFISTLVVLGLGFIAVIRMTG